MGLINIICVILAFNCFIYKVQGKKGGIDLYVLGDDALISKGSFMQTKYLCVLIHI